MTLDQFKRKATLMRNPEGLGDEKRCPECKKLVHVDEMGDMRCEDFTLDYKTKGGCFWHRWSDGTNYWTDATELMQKLKEKYGNALAPEEKVSK